ncbi:MAG: hypothetical protein ACUVSA_07345 [Desulfosoma sp.]|uniref:hypothetical protein n=1 Tax=Desulfosoma sp. TaxID=2603217 RepID=UPI00404A65F9
MVDVSTEQLIQWMHIARVQQHILAHAHLAEATRGLLIRTLVERGLVTSSWLESAVQKALQVLGLPDEPEHRQQVSAAFTGILAARAFSEKEIQDHIHLAQKLERFQILHRMINAERATSTEIQQALKEFCAVPPKRDWLFGIQGGADRRRPVLTQAQRLPWL